MDRGSEYFRFHFRRRRGHAGPPNIKVLFIAGFGPIVRETDKSRKLYSELLGIPFKEESDGYLDTEAIKGAKLLPYGRFLRRRNHVLAKILGLAIFLRHRSGLSLTLRAALLLAPQDAQTHAARDGLLAEVQANGGEGSAH